MSKSKVLEVISIVRKRIADAASVYKRRAQIDCAEYRELSIEDRVYVIDSIKRGYGVKNAWGANSDIPCIVARW
jgi:hypothetical protein